VKLATGRYGRLDILVNRRDRHPRVAHRKTGRRRVDRVMAVNAKGVFLGPSTPSRDAPGRRRLHRQHLLVAGIGQSLHQAGVCGSKGAIRIFTKVTASQHAKDRIRCNSCIPAPSTRT